MLVPYELAKGKIIQIEVSEAVARLLADFKREDESYRRKMRRHNELSVDALREATEFEPLDITADVEQNYIEQEERNELNAAIAKLSKKDNALITAIYYNEVPAQEYAEQHGVSFQAVYKRLFKIYGKIKNILEQKG